MFHQLIESGARRRGHSGWTLASTGVHGMIVAGAITLTMNETVRRGPADIITEKIYFAPAPPPAPRPAAPPSHGSFVESTIQAPTQIPIDLPPIPQVSFPVDQPRVGGETMLVSRGIGIGMTPDTVDGRIYSAERVERAVVARRGNGQPVYPAKLRSAAVEGEVLVQFVVDSTGRVELQSIEVLRTTHEQFAESVRRWLSGTRYQPAQIGNTPVRQLVQQQIGFTLR